MKAPISVIIPCYRCADTISRAVDSVLAQTLQPEEVFLIDDCSNDDGKTLKILNKIQLESIDIKIKVIYLKKNCGPGSARNAGWDQATQPYLAFLDSDDSWHPKKLEGQYQWMCQHPDVVLTGHPSIKFSLDYVLPEIVDGRSVTKCGILVKNYFPTRSVMLKSDISFRFFPGKRYAEDYLLWLFIILSRKQACFLKFPAVYTYKEEFGESGLAGDLWLTQQGVIDTYEKIYRSGMISWPVFIVISIFSWLKYCRRWLITMLRVN